MGCNNTTGLATLGCCGQGSGIYSAQSLCALHNFRAFTKGNSYLLYLTLRTNIHWHFTGDLETWGIDADLEFIEHFNPRLPASLQPTGIILTDTRVKPPEDPYRYLDYYLMEGSALSEPVREPAEVSEPIGSWCGSFLYWRELRPGTRLEATVTLSLENEYTSAGDMNALLTAVDLQQEGLSPSDPENPCGDYSWDVSFDVNGVVQKQRRNYTIWTPWSLFQKDEVGDPPFGDLYSFNPFKRLPAGLVTMGGYSERRGYSCLTVNNPDFFYDGGVLVDPSYPGLDPLFPWPDFHWGWFDGPWIAFVERKVQKVRLTTKSDLCLHEWRFGQRPWPLPGTGRDTWEAQPLAGSNHTCAPAHPIGRANNHPRCPARFGKTYLDMYYAPAQDFWGNFINGPNDVFAFKLPCDKCT